VIELTNIGTLFAFVLVAIGVLILRKVDPDRPRPFRAPAIWVVAPMAVLSCSYLMVQLPGITWMRFGIWLAVGLVLYALYGYGHSRLRRA
jgi:APA family basic amino acid/polyamine antiporter